MSILSGFFKTKKYRKTEDGYKLQSEWTSASTVELADGTTLETALGRINTSINQTNTNLNQTNINLNQTNTNLNQVQTAMNGKKIQVLTKAAFDALPAGQKNDASILYFYY